MSTRKRRVRRTDDQIIADMEKKLAQKKAKQKQRQELVDRPDLECYKAVLRETNQYDKKVKGPHRNSAKSKLVLEFREKMIALWIADGRVVPSTRNRPLGTGSGKIVPLDEKPKPKKKPSSSKKKKRGLGDV